MVKIKLDNGNILYYAQGKFDRWCVYEMDKEGKRKAPKDPEYFAELEKLKEKFKAEDIYSDFVTIYDLTTKSFDEEVVNQIKQISLKYGEYSSQIFRIFSIIYMAMISEENKANTKLGRRIKRLGLYYLLIKGETPEYSSNFMKNKKWQEIDKLCQEGGF